MSHIHSRDTRPELAARRELWRRGFRYRVNVRKLPGTPDIVLPKYRTAIFVNGCFWHRCPRCNPSTPRKNTEYWTAKFTRNVERDRENLEALRADGWTVHVIWECQLKKATREETFAELLPELSRELGKPLS